MEAGVVFPQYRGFLKHVLGGDLMGAPQISRRQLFFPVPAPLALEEILQGRNSLLVTSAVAEPLGSALQFLDRFG